MSTGETLEILKFRHIHTCRLSVHDRSRTFSIDIAIGSRCLHVLVSRFPTSNNSKDPSPVFPKHLPCFFPPLLPPRPYLKYLFADVLYCQSHLEKYVSFQPLPDTLEVPGGTLLKPRSMDVQGRLGELREGQDLIYFQCCRIIYNLCNRLPRSRTVQRARASYELMNGLPALATLRLTRNYMTDGHQSDLALKQNLSKYCGFMS